MNATLANYEGKDVECFLQIKIIVLQVENELQMDVTIVKPNQDYLRIVTLKLYSNLKPRHVGNIFYNDADCRARERNYISKIFTRMRKY